jgi:hypothetical protein
MNLDDAKAEALKKLAAFADGVDPVASAKREKMAGTTLQQALEDMLAARRYKASTAEDYKRSLKPLCAWAKRPLAAITGPQITNRYKALAGHSAKARTFRVLRAVWHFAKDRTEAEGAAFPPFPGGALRDARKGWASAPRKRRTVPDAAMPQWKTAILTLRADVFERRTKDAGDGLLFDFGSIRKQWEPTRSICEWSPHDLRRGYITMAHRLGVDEEVARALTGHAIKDAHGGYVVFTADMLRAEAQHIADALDRHRLATASPVVSLVGQRQAA